MAEYATLIFKADTSDLDEAEKALRRLAKEGKISESALAGLTKQTEKTRKPFRMMRGGAQNLSFQLQDVAVQAQMGTDAFIILGQQGPQIASVFGAGGAAVGALIAFGAIIAGVVSRSLFMASNAIEETIKKAREFKGELSELNEEGKALQLSIVAQQMRETSTEINELKQQTEDVVKRFKLFQGGTSNLFTQLDQITSGFLDFKESQRDSAQEVLANAAAIKDAEERYAELVKQADILTGKTDEVTQATTNQRESLESYLRSLEEQFATLGMNTVQLGVYKAMQEGATVSEIRAVRAILEKIEAYKQAQKAAEDAARAEEQAARESARAEERAARERETFQKRLNKARFEAIVDARNERIEAEEEAARQQEQKEKERNERIFAEQKRHMERVFEEHKRMEQERIENARIVNQGLLGLEDKLMKGKSEKQKAGYRTLVNVLNQEKRERAVNIISTSYDAAMKAYAALAGIPIIGPALGAGAAATVIAAGVSFAAQSLSGRALGGQVRAGESYVVGERGPEVLTMGNTGGRVIPNERLASTSGQVVNKTANVTFNIMANDTRGFDTLLQQRRGQIVSIINSALNDRGRPALV